MIWCVISYLGDITFGYASSPPPTSSLSVKWTEPATDMENFVKPHMALEGHQTPAKKIGIEINGNNKWSNLLESSIKKD
jgi:hypothetical protein